MTNKIEYWRLQKAANLTNSQAKELFNVNRSTINRWRNGEIIPPNSVILVLRSLVENKAIGELI